MHFSHKKSFIALLSALAVFACFMSACGKAPADTPPSASVPTEMLAVDSTEMESIFIEDEAVALAQSPAAISTQLRVQASGTLTKQNAEAVIDYSNTKDGYVMVKYTAETSQRLKAQVKGPSTTYTYNLTAGQWEVFPLSDGSGAYQVTLYRNVSGSKYAAVLSLSTKAELSDEFAPFPGSPASA